MIKITTETLFSVLENMGLHGFCDEIGQKIFSLFSDFWARFSCSVQSKGSHSLCTVDWVHSTHSTPTPAEAHDPTIQLLLVWLHAARHRVSGAGPISTTHYEWEHVTRCTQPGAPTCPYMGQMRSRDWAVITWPLAPSIYGQSGKQRRSDTIYGHWLAAVSCDPDCQPLKITL